MADPNLTIARVREILDYNPDTGVFTYLKANGRKKAGDTGTLLPIGYVQVTLDGVKMHGHRLAFFYMNGEWPARNVDHINGVRSDNRRSNLRDVSQAANTENQRKARVDNKSGFLDVCPNGKRWMALIRIKGKQTYLGTFDTPEEAHSAYVAGKRKLHGGCTI